MPKLSQRENALVRRAIKDRIEATELAIEALDEPDERYERNDLQQDLAALRSALYKLEAVK